MSAEASPLPYPNADNYEIITNNSLTDSTSKPPAQADHAGSKSNNNRATNSTIPKNSITPPTIKIIRSKRPSRICCEYCQKSFPNHSKMIWHRRMHEPNRPRFNCSFEGCNRTYLSRQSCNLHYKQMHCSRADFQPFECGLCYKTFAIAQTLEVHMRYHTRQFPFECSHCERRFGQKSHLTAHVQVKHNNFRYICPVTGCGKMFKNTISLRNHSYSHTVMPFRCAYCDRGYPQKSRLKVHLKLKHGIIMSVEELESMRKCKTDRTRHSFVKLEIPQGDEISESQVTVSSVDNDSFEDVSEEIEVNIQKLD